MATIKVLSELPGVFHATDMLLLSKAPLDQLNQIFWRWKKAGYIKSLGNRSDVWFNLMVDPNITRERWERAVRRSNPSAICAGHSVLMRSGLSTQMTNKEYLIRPAKSASHQIDGAELHERPAMWIRKLNSCGAISYEGGLPELDPGAAVADLLIHDPSMIDEDEIDWDDASENSKELFKTLMGSEDSKEERPRQLRESC